MITFTNKYAGYVNDLYISDDADQVDICNGADQIHISNGTVQIDISNAANQLTLIITLMTMIDISKGDQLEISNGTNQIDLVTVLIKFHNNGGSNYFDNNNGVYLAYLNNNICIVDWLSHKLSK